MREKNLVQAALVIAAGKNQVWALVMIKNFLSKSQLPEFWSGTSLGATSPPPPALASSQVLHRGCSPIKHTLTHPILRSADLGLLDVPKIIKET